MSWTTQDKIESRKQGWGLFNADGKLQLQRWDEAGIFEDDAEAWMYVYGRAQAKDSLATRALARLILENPEEIARIKEYLFLLEKGIKLTI